MSDTALMSQTRYGSALYPLDVRSRPQQGSAPQRCSGEDNAPFVWLDAERLLALTLPEGEVSGLIDEAGRPAAHAERMEHLLRHGREATVSAVGSGAERLPEGERTGQARIAIVDPTTGSTETVAEIPTYPFQGELTLAPSPDGRSLAILATVGTIQPAAAETPPYNDESWLAEKRLGFVALQAGAEPRWVPMPPETSYPLELFGWSPDGRQVAFRGRATLSAKTTPLFTASAESLAVERVGGDGITVGGPTAGARWPRGLAHFWLENGAMLARVDGTEVAPRNDWWLLRTGAEPVNATAALAEPPQELRRAADGSLYFSQGGRLHRLDIARRRAVPIGGAGAKAERIAWPREPQRVSSHVLAATTQGGKTVYRRISIPSGRSGGAFTLATDAALLQADDDAVTALWRHGTERGTDVGAVAVGGASRKLLALNSHFADVKWGERRVIDYTLPDGKAAKAALILPPGYEEGKRYPTIVWFYPGYEVRGPGDYFVDPYLPGIYNLQVYASAGYAILIPTVRFDASGEDPLGALARDVLSGVDRAVALGIADPERLGAMGQSFGGFGVYALVTQTNRFKSAIALAGIADFTSYYGAFEAAARGYPGTEHEKSVNWVLAEVGQMHFNAPPYEQPDLYRRLSPLSHADAVDTPLLLIHGEYDKRATMSQAEAFFMSLYRQGKTARLLRYWGESHALNQSPANVRDIVSEITAWFGKYLAKAPAAGQ